MQPKDIVCNIEQHVFNNTSLITHSLYDLLTTRIGQRCSLRPSVLGQDRSQNKKIGLGLGLAGLLLCCETRCCHGRRHNDLEGHSNFSSTIYSFSVLCLEHRTVKINSGVHLLKS